MRGFKLNNPGNLRISPATWQGKVKSEDGEFEQFASVEDGVRAMMKNIQNQQKLHGLNTVSQVLNRYAPPGENDTNAYIQFVADKTGIDPNAPLDLQDPETLIPLAKAIVHQEQGKDGLIDDETYKSAYGKIGGDGEYQDPFGPFEEDFGASDADADFGADDQEVGPADREIPDFGASDVTTPAVKAPKTWEQWASEIPGVAGRQTLQGGTFGFADEIMNPIAAAASTLISDPVGFMKGEVSDPFLADEILGNYGNEQDRLAQDWEEHPITSFTSQLAGAIPVSMGGANALKAGATKIAPQLAADVAQIAKQYPGISKTLLRAGAGAGGGGLYAAGASQGDIGERAEDAAMGAAFGAPLSVFGSPIIEAGVKRVAPYVGAAANGVKNLGSKIFGMLDDEGAGAATNALAGMGDDLAAAATPDNPGNINPITLAGILDEDSLANLEQGKVLPLTAGDRTQNVNTQRMEEMAAKAGSGPMLAARAQQQDAAYQPFVGILGDEQNLTKPALSTAAQDEAQRAADIVRGQYDELGAKVNAAYKTARDTGEGVGIGSGEIEKDFLDKVHTSLAAEYYRPGEIPQLDNALEEMTTIINPTAADGTKMTLDSVKLNELEAWKKRFNRNVIGDLGSNPDKLRLARQVNRHYDDFLTNLADDAIVNGDTKAINAFKDARGLAKQKFSFYESDKAVAKILDTRDLSGSQLVNTIFGAGKLSGKGENGRLTETMLKLAGDKAPAMREAMQRGVMAKMLKNSLSGVSDPNNLGRDLISFTNMKKELGTMMENKEFFETIFDPTEQKYFGQLYDDLRLASSKQAGAVNNSSTGSYIADFITSLGKVTNNPLFRHVPGVGSVTTYMQGAIDKQAEAIILGKAEKGLDEFLLNQANQLDAPAMFYGGAAAGGVVPQSLLNTVNPDDLEDEQNDDRN